MTTFYISGPMRAKPEFNHPMFFEVEKALGVYIAKTEKKKPTILNPARNFDGDTNRTVAEYMTVDLAAVLKADVIVLLPDWEISDGAEREVSVAKWTGKKFWLAVHAPEGDKKQTGYAGWEFVKLDVPPSKKPSPRADALTEATALITGDRNNQYGPPTQDFRRSADMMTALGYRHTQLPLNAPPCPQCGARAIQPHDTAIQVTTIKLSRLMWTPAKRDHWVDVAGYAGCGYECAVEEAKSA